MWSLYSAGMPQPARHYKDNQPALLRLRRKYGRYSGNEHYSANFEHYLFPSVPSDVTGTTVGNRHCSTGTIQEPLLKRCFVVL